MLVLKHKFAQKLQTLEIIYQDNWLVAINKPHGLLVHRTKIAEEKEDFALQILRDQIGAKVYPSHRLDRKTAGVLIFSKDESTDVAMKRLFEHQKVEKKYIALVRGYLPDYGVVDKPLAKENGQLQDALTHYQCLDKIELPIAVSRYPTSRYSIALVEPKTGRMHQIRRHMAHIRHYIIQDKTHGECKQNKMFEQHFNHYTMMLHALETHFIHPVLSQEITIKAPLQLSFKNLLLKMGFQQSPLETYGINLI